MFRYVPFILSFLLVSTTANDVVPLTKIIKLAFSVSISSYLPFEESRYIKNGHINCRTKSDDDPKYETICCDIGGWVAEGYERKATEVVLFTHSQQKLAVFGFRGTERLSWSDWKKNAEVKLVEASIGSKKFKLHKGFRDRYMDISSWFENEYKAIPTDYTIIITGHSLGGALATISAVYASGRLNRHPDAVISFASPYVGDQNFRNYYVDMVGCDHTIRITAEGDSVTSFHTSKQYIHVCDALKVDGTEGKWWRRINILKMHSLYDGYKKGLAGKFSSEKIDFGCDKQFKL